MSLPQQIWDWLSDGSNWSGSTGIPSRLAEHLVFSASSVAIACLIAIPLGLWLGHIGHGGTLAISISNIGRAIPTYALLVLLFVAVGVTHRTFETVLALVAFAVPPLLVNTYVGVREVDPEAREAAVGMGMSGRQVLRQVELPLAMPLIMDGLRIAVVTVVATTTVAALIGAGGLGRFVVDGFNNDDPGQYGGGAVIVGVLALLLESLFILLQRRIDPVRRARRSRSGSGPVKAEAEATAEAGAAH
ncbi:MAG TPA: ABC transporter permease [Mycobacteriales bacterium]|jgi:osmoprotectant transport system permease protein